MMNAFDRVEKPKPRKVPAPFQLLENKVMYLENSEVSFKAVISLFFDFRKVSLLVYEI